MLLCPGFPEDDYRIEDFEWSRDGKQLAFSRSRTTWDIVLFRGLTLDCVQDDWRFLDGLCFIFM